MAIQNPCPDPDRLRKLLVGDLPQAMQAELSGHLDTCLNCQQTLEGLATGGESIPGSGRSPNQGQPAPESALRHAIDALKGDASEAATRAGPGTASDADLDFLSPPAQAGHLGRLGYYDVIDVVGRGGMGVVLMAFDASLQRTVAIKVLAQHLAASETSRKRFIREARAAAAIHHEHVITVHAVDESGKLPYFVMEYVPGISVQDRLDRGGPLELDEILSVGMQAAAGLAAAHARGLIHRDIKPANLLLRQELAPAAAESVVSPSSLKITDFGLARAVDDVSLTQSGVVAGTPQYMAPEQARGETLDHRADLFSLGSVLYAMCTGKPPFTGDNTVAVLYNVCAESPRPLPEANPTIPDWLTAIVEKLHAKKPDDRFQSASEVAELLRQHLMHRQRPSLIPMPRGPERQVPEAPRADVVLPKWVRGRDYRSKTVIWGLPLIHIATGYDLKTGRKRVAKGIIAMGDIAVGVVAFGGMAVGGIAFGGLSLGLLAFGGCAVAVGLAVGGAAIGGIALGGGAVGLIALGGGAVGYYAFGGGAVGAHPLCPTNVDPEALEFFSDYLGSWVRDLYQPMSRPNR